MSYYESNGIYEYLKENNIKDFFWTSLDKWILVYGNDRQEPKVVSVVVKASGNSEGVSQQEKNIISVVKCIVKDTDIHMNFIRYDADKPLETVQYWEAGSAPLETITMDDLRNRFIHHGIKMNENKTKKLINDRSSSQYNEWQRENMGSDVTVSDIDLIRFKGNEIKEIIELKRSIIPLERWNPYKADFNNFILLSKLAVEAGIGFYIAYNYRQERPFLDDISYIKLFEFDYRMKEYYKFIRYLSIEEFVSDFNPSLN